ncbi:MAG: hypothetical protein HKN25_04910 [Pyrinomonadaceae bacterium]|nr:hypothetical protein [Pyrinomonadaceae bacterium]
MDREPLENSDTPKTIRGRLEEAFVGDLDGTDSIVSGWIETENGDVLIYLLNSELERAGVRDNDQVEADIVPGREDDGEMHYKVIDIRPIDRSSGQ